MTQKIVIARRGYQAKRRPTEEELSEWRAETGLKLPDEYRRFLKVWNGGTLSPFVFSHQHPEAGQDEERLVLEVLLDWDEVKYESQLDDAPSIRSVPPLHLVIGEDPRDICLLLSLAPQTYGRIRTWYKNYDLIWGEPGNDRIGEVAEGFIPFIESLADGGPDFYHSFWSNPETAPDNPEMLRF